MKERVDTQNKFIVTTYREFLNEDGRFRASSESWEEFKRISDALDYQRDLPDCNSEIHEVSATFNRKKQVRIHAEIPPELLDTEV